VNLAPFAAPALPHSEPGTLSGGSGKLRACHSFYFSHAIRSFLDWLGDELLYASGVTVLEVIQKSTEFLARRGVESPRLNAELLAAHVLRMPRLQLYLNFERPLSESEVDALRQLVKRRGDREPCQHLIGSCSFCGYEIQVCRDALIPRPETELLAEKGWTFLGARASDRPIAVDLGTGSGCLAIVLAQKCPRAQIYAIDCSPAALAVASANIAAHGLTERVTCSEGDGLAALPSVLRGKQRIDLLISNPPYIPTAEIAQLMPEVRDFDPHIALDGGPDGLAFYRRLASEALPELQPDGRLMLELGDGQADAVGKLFHEAGWQGGETVLDWSGRARIFVAQPAPP